MGKPIKFKRKIPKFWEKKRSIVCILKNFGPFGQNFFVIGIAYYNFFWKLSNIKSSHPMRILSQKNAASNSWGKKMRPFSFSNSVWYPFAQFYLEETSWSCHDTLTHQILYTTDCHYYSKHQWELIQQYSTCFWKETFENWQSGKSSISHYTTQNENVIWRLD